MDSYQKDTYGDRIAGVYDELYAEYEPAAITTLKELAQGGRALELGIGTGRVALPLQESGVEVHGIDASAAMVSRLRAKPGGEKLPVTIGNFADVPVEGRYDLVYVLFNTFYGLLTQEEQIRCFQNVAAHLNPEGVFVIEAFVPDLTRYQGRQTVRVVRTGVSEVQLDTSQIDPVDQQISSQHILISEQGTRLYPVKLRYVWPAEFDLMARFASMALKHRWSNWQKAAFPGESGKHVSVYCI
jgi:SAM-dependent methyltransferase